MKSLELLKIIFDSLEKLTFETYNQDYDALTFSVKSLTYRSRLAKKTPIKKGYFVTLWTKGSDNKNRSFNYEESTDFVLILISDDINRGCFSFPKDILKKHGILSTGTSSGKMGFRVYPPWCIDLNDTARTAQYWQEKFFINL